MLEARLAETIQPSSRSEQQQQPQQHQQQQQQQQEQREHHEGELNLIIPPYPNMPNPYDLGGIELQGVVTSNFFYLLFHIRKLGRNDFLRQNKRS